MPVVAADHEPTAADTDRYHIDKEIGRGGMGDVRLARDTRVDREVAVKLLRPEHRNPENIARFFREAHIQGRLDHPSVVPVHDLGIDRDGAPYFVMKRLSAMTLAEVLAARTNDAALRTKWPRRQLLARFVDVCLAVEFAHTRGVIHRDLKPANIMLGDFGEVYVLDWGLARVADELRPSGTFQPAPGDSGPGHTAVGSLLGTPGYMPPEQIRDASVDAGADVYALGCILYEILTGHAALPSGMRALDATLAAACHRPSERYPELVAPELDEICAHATAHDRTERPTARAVADAIQAYLDGDRDVARRRDLARVHARRAQEAFAIPGDIPRARAMREAGRALVLDPNNVDAQSVLAHLLLEAPNLMPAEARADADRERGLVRQAMLRWIWRGYAGLIVLMLLVFLLLPVHHPALLITMTLLTVATGVSTYLASRELGMRRPIFLVVNCLNASTLLCAAFVFGPFLIVPISVIGSLAATLSQPTGYRWQVLVAPYAVAYILPLALEWIGVVPSTYHVDHGLVLTPWVLELVPTLTAALMVAALVSQAAITVALVLIERRARTISENRLHAQSWHLRQLLPRRTTDKKRGTTGETAIPQRPPLD